MSDNKVYNVGMIGFGFMGKTHLFGYHTIPFYYGESPIKVKFKAICARTQKTVDLAMDSYGFENGTTNLDEFFENNNLDIVHICTPNLLHKDNILRAIEKGVHIYCEKPLTVSYQDALEIEEAVQKSGKIFQMVFNNRFFPSTIRAKQMIDSGEMGELIAVRCRYLLASNLSPTTPATWRQSGPDQGGVLMDLGSHVIDLVHYLAGEIDSVCGKTRVLYDKRPDGRGGKVNVSQNDGFMAMIQMKNKAFGIIEGSKITSGTNNDTLVELNFTKGSLRLDLENPNWLYYYSENDKGGAYGGDRGYKKIETVNRYPERVFPSEKHPIGWLQGHVYCLYSFLDCIRHNNKATPSVSDGAYVQHVIAKILQSENQQGFVKV